MRLWSLMFGIICVGITGIGTPAGAQNYPWCANYSGGGVGTNCGTVSGIGGFCEPNTQYQPPPGPRGSTKVFAR
jgi:hypothetical protein